MCNTHHSHQSYYQSENNIPFILETELPIPTPWGALLSLLNPSCLHCGPGTFIALRPYQLIVVNCQPPSLRTENFCCLHCDLQSIANLIAPRCWELLSPSLRPSESCFYCSQRLITAIEHHHCGLETVPPSLWPWDRTTFTANEIGYPLLHLHSDIQRFCVPDTLKTSLPLIYRHWPLTIVCFLILLWWHMY